MGIYQVRGSAQTILLARYASRFAQPNDRVHLNPTIQTPQWQCYKVKKNNVVNRFTDHAKQERALLNPDLFFCRWFWIGCMGATRPIREGYF